jgi:hypothetical protein
MQSRDAQGMHLFTGDRFCSLVHDQVATKPRLPISTFSHEETDCNLTSNH